VIRKDPRQARPIKTSNAKEKEKGKKNDVARPKKALLKGGNKAERKERKRKRERKEGGATKNTQLRILGN